MPTQGLRTFEDEFLTENTEGLHPGEQEVSNYMRIVQPPAEHGTHYTGQGRYRPGFHTPEGAKSGYDASSESSGDEAEDWAKRPSDLLRALRHG
ncbi:uncharacterized protein DSM5745_01023 [Aspergillus mulundensis]|uniref:Uncharacterized protein n=1 Tax=Aspergillus mulundensis TaxID=1810919 RepID=A0A3D8T5I7_9EURO|nr:hypothetical protein DSM5745_01023 [Aspergillus mulundensis]RDW93701.1 hypothetical protein DSM5745_01023 [Aspergillus mulundensis]